MAEPESEATAAPEPEPRPDPQPDPQSALPDETARRIEEALAQIEALVAIAKDAGAVGGALARLAAAEASLSVTALRRAFVLRIAAAALGAIAALYLLIAATVGLAELTGSAALAILIIGLAFGSAATFAFRRASAWRSKVGFAATREALAGLRAEPPK